MKIFSLVVAGVFFVICLSSPVLARSRGFSVYGDMPIPSVSSASDGSENFSSRVEGGSSFGILVPFSVGKQVFFGRTMSNVHVSVPKNTREITRHVGLTNLRAEAWEAGLFTLARESEWFGFGLGFLWGDGQVTKKNRETGEESHTNTGVWGLKFLVDFEITPLVSIPVALRTLMFNVGGSSSAIVYSGITVNF